jgi:hypothetical protein
MKLIVTVFALMSGAKMCGIAVPESRTRAAPWTSSWIDSSSDSLKRTPIGVGRLLCDKSSVNDPALLISWSTISTVI